MTPGLLLPLGLAALAALAVPLAIHIARRTETRVVEFAALRWLSAQPRPRLRPILDERVLLAARLILLALLALWLARPVMWGVEDRRPVTAIAPSLPVTAADDADPRARQVWLAPGFPDARQPAPAASEDLVSLMRQLDAELPAGAPLEIVVPAVLDGADAERPRLSRTVRWRVAPTTPGEAAAAAPAPPALVVRHSDEGRAGVRYLRAVATAWTAPGETPAFDAQSIDRPIDPAGPAGTTATAWLAASPPPRPVVDWVRGGGVLLVSHDAPLDLATPPVPAWRDGSGAILATSGRLGRGRVVRLTRPLTPAALPQVLEPDFPDVLERLLAPAPPPARVAAADHAPLTGATVGAPPGLELRPWLGLLIVLVFALERGMATRRRRGLVP